MIKEIIELIDARVIIYLFKLLDQSCNPSIDESQKLLFHDCFLKIKNTFEKFK